MNAVACPQCGAAVDSSRLTDHGIQSHDLRRPPELNVVIALHVLAGALCVYVVLEPLGRLLPLLTGGSDFGRAFAALILAALLIVGAYGVALLLVAHMMWRADRAGRVLAIILCATLCLGLLAGGADDGTSRWIELVTAAIVVVLLISNGVRGWFAGPFARQREEPTTVVVARSLGGAVAWFGFVLGAAFCIVLTIDDSQVGYAVAVVSGTLLLATSVGALARRDTNARIRASIGLALIGGALLVSDASASGTYIVLGPAIVVLCLLFLPESSQQWFAGVSMSSSSVMSPPPTLINAGPTRKRTPVDVDASTVIHRLTLAGATHASASGTVTHMRLPRSAITVESLDAGGCTVWIDAADGAVTQLVDRALVADGLDD